MKLLRELLREDIATPGNVDGAFDVGVVKFDNEHGLGSTPNGQNILYRGFVAFIKPSVFRELCTAADRSETKRELLALMKDGTGIATPQLYCDIIGDLPHPEKILVQGHEGRARSDAFKELNGDVPMPVQFHFHGLRARDFSPEFFEHLSRVGIQAERSKTVVNMNATEYFCGGKRIKG